MASAPVGSVESASKLQIDYLNLLVTQLKNQDPTNPVDNSQMTSQLAQISQLQQMENLNSNFSQVLESTQIMQANELIGRQVSYMPSGSSTATSGLVSAVTIDNNGVSVHIGKDSVPVSSLTSIQAYQSNAH